ncbi:M48 family metallopeptidase [Clostridium chrysemydis]|uniref:M48 family metallopeptidase n=1 Tax=Clostridium chrysemydis TaxID=2665504 RepID=UPI0018835FAE|nr:SprT-like domain-containing protein [Clostridium chrysemydis]
MNYELIRKNTNYIKFKVRNRKIIVIAPFGMPYELIEKYIQKFKEKFKKEINDFKIAYLLDKEPLSEILYLGKKYTLKLEKSITEISIKDNLIVIPIVKEDINTSLLNWYKKRAEDILLGFCKKWEKILNINSKKIRLKLMKTRWGSCNYNKRYINLNIELLTKTMDFIDYVVLHEYAHIFHPNHSKEFYDFIRLYKPNYEIIIKTQR